MAFPEANPPPAPAVGTVFETAVTRMGRDGEGVGTAPDGRVAFIWGALPGERVRAEVQELHRNYLRARLKAVVAAAPARVAPACPWFGQCGGCAFQHWAYAEELAYKQDRVVQALRRVGGMAEVPVGPILSAPAPYAYRNKGQFAWANRDGKPVLGFFRRGSHRVVAVKGCAIQRELVMRVAGAAAALAARLGLPAYDEGSRQGLLRHLLVRVDREQTAALAVAVVAQEEGWQDRLQAWARDLMAEQPAVRGVLLNINPDPGNRVLGPHTRLLAGTDRLLETIAGARFWMTGPAFFQVNPEAVERLYGIILDWLQEALPAGDDAQGALWDLYGGVGTLAVLMARRWPHRQVVLVEREAAATRLAEANAQLNGVADRLAVETAAAERALALLHRHHPPAAVVVDPPRAGLSAEVVAALRAGPARALVYVSCNPESLARDGARLTAGDGPGAPFAARKAQPVDMFPRTDHVETVMLFAR